MSILTKTEIEKLSKYRQPNAVSIFIPTHRFGEDTLEGKDALNLKNQLKEVSHKLEENGMHPNEIEKYLQPARDLLKESKYWRNQSDGLAIFINGDVFEKFEIPVHFEAFNYVSDEFYLKPLMPFFNENGRFYLLNLEIGNLKFYSCDKHYITEIDMKKDLPQRLEDVVGYDYEQKTLQFRTQQGNQGKGQYHGHLDEDSDHKNEILRYFQDVDEAIMNLIESQHDAPLVVACLDYHFGLYKKANSYQQLYPENVEVTLRDTDLYLLHEKAWKKVKPHFSKKKKEKLAQFQELQGTGKTSKDIKQIVPAADNGKIDVLFIKNRAEEIMGTFDREKQDVHLNGEAEMRKRSLLNLAAMRVMAQGGDVYLLDKEEMPNDESSVNALFRY